jgi:hypothetical protein
MYVNDFDLNGAIEQIICVYDDDKSYPLALVDIQTDTNHEKISQI